MDHTDMSNPIAYAKYIDAKTANKDHKLIIFDQNATKFMTFENARAYIAYKTAHYDRKNVVPSHHEVIDETTWHKLMLDVDVDIGQTEVPFDTLVLKFHAVVRQIVECAMDTYYTMFDEMLVPNDILICESLNEAESYKLSAHIIIQRAVPDFRVARVFADRIIEMIPVKRRHFIDRGIYASKHNLRMLGSAKPDSVRVKRITDLIGHIRFTDEADALRATLISDDCQHIPSGHYTQLAPTKIAQTSNQSSLSQSTIQSIIDAVVAKHGPDAHEFRKCIGDNSSAILQFRRKQSSMCFICARNHDHDNTLYVVARSQANGNINAIECCHHAPGKTVALPGFARQQNNRTEIDRALCAVQDEPGGAVAAAACASAAAPARPKREVLVPKTMYESMRQEIYSESAMRDYIVPADIDTIYIQAPMKLGKTRALRRYISEHHTAECAKVLFVSFRRTFSSSTKASFPEFRIYSDIKGPLSENKMIVQVESLHRIVPEQLGQLDLLVMDESESILEQFDSGLSSDAHGDFAVFKWLVRSAKRLIAMDAFMSERTVAVLRRLRTAPRALSKEQFIWNQYQNAREDMYYVCNDRTQWMLAMEASLAQTDTVDPIVVCTNSASEAYTMQEWLNNKLRVRWPDIRIRVYSAETPTQIKKRDFADVNEYWSQWDILIYTPTISAGVSFENIHFSKMFCYFTNMSCTAQVCMQMMGRIRNVSSKQYFICLSGDQTSYPETAEDVVLYLRLRKRAICSTDVSFEIEYDNRGLPTIQNTDYSELRIHNILARNKSSNAFGEMLFAYIKTTGANIRKLTDIVHAELFARELSQFDHDRIDDEHSDARDLVERATAEAISASRELSIIEYNTIRAKMESTEEDIRAMQKHELRITYNYNEPVMSPEFVIAYNHADLIQAYKNLDVLCRAMMRHDGNVLASLEYIRSLERRHVFAADAITLPLEPVATSTIEIRDIDDGKHIDTGYLELHYNYEYETHRLAHNVVRVFGFASVLDTGVQVARVADLTVEERGLNSDVAGIVRQIKKHFRIKNAQRAVPFTEIAASVLEQTYQIYLIKAGEFYRLVLHERFRICPNGAIALNI